MSLPSARRTSAPTWPTRWFTPYSGLPVATASAFAAPTPTMSAPASPGPAVTATASSSSSVTPARSRASCSVGVIASRCARAATSGTTPPYRACSSMLEAITFASSVPPRTMPTPVSSQLVSMPSTRGPPARTVSSSVAQLVSMPSTRGSVALTEGLLSDGSGPDDDGASSARITHASTPSGW